MWMSSAAGQVNFQHTFWADAVSAWVHLQVATLTRHLQNHCTQPLLSPDVTPQCDTTTGFCLSQAQVQKCYAHERFMLSIESVMLYYMWTSCHDSGTSVTTVFHQQERHTIRHCRRHVDTPSHLGLSPGYLRPVWTSGEKHLLQPASGVLLLSNCHMRAFVRAKHSQSAINLRLNLS